MPSRTLAKKGYKIVNGYLMGDVLGEGSQAKVREALDVESLLRVAIKIVNTQKLRKVRNSEESLRLELRLHRRLKHPHVVELFEYFNRENKPKVYIVLEHVAGGSLKNLLDNSPKGILPTSWARRFGRQLFKGLEHCHSQSVVHRDIKPSNLLVTLDGEVKIADFGSAEELSMYDESDTCSKFKGSPAFQPPEVAAGSTSFSGVKVDVWAAGVTLFVMTTGGAPFDGSSLMHLFEKIASADAIEMPPSVAADEPLLGLLRGLLTADAATRFAVSDALSHPWLNQYTLMQWSATDRRSPHHGDLTHDVLLPAQPCFS